MKRHLEGEEMSGEIGSGGYPMRRRESRLSHERKGVGGTFGRFSLTLIGWISLDWGGSSDRRIGQVSKG